MELYLEPERKPSKERGSDGRFLKGYNGLKGKKRVVTDRMRKSLLENLKNANKATGRKWTCNGRSVIGIKLDKSVVVFPSAKEAERRMGFGHSVVSYRCNGRIANRFAGGLYWYWEDDPEWVEFINKL